MALSQHTYTGDGATVNFAFNKGYIQQSDVKVYVDGALQSTPVNYSWTGATTVTFNIAPASGAVVFLDRDTQQTSRLVDFQDATVVTEANLDQDSNQLLYISQEAIDASGSLEGIVTGSDLGKTARVSSSDTGRWEADPRPNLIDNGNFDVWQRGTSFASIANGVFSADRWKQVHSTDTGVVTHTRDASTPDGSSQFSLKTTVDTADASIATSEYMGISHTIEGYQAAPAKFGGSTAESVALSFWVRSSVPGTYCVALRNGAPSRSYVVEYTINAADTWEKKTATFAGDTGGTWNNDESAGMQLVFTLAAGTVFQKDAGTWTGAGTSYATANQTQWLSTLGATFHLSQVKLEVGESASLFAPEPRSQELQRCHRYHWRDKGNGIAGVIASASEIYLAYQFPTPMRATPTQSLVASTVTVYDSTTSRTSGAATHSAATKDETGGRFGVTGFSGLTTGRAVVSANAGAIFAFDAEL